MTVLMNLLTAKHPCIFPPETSSFTAGRPCAERIRSRALGGNADGFISPNVYYSTNIFAPMSAASAMGRGNTMLRSSEVRRRTGTKACGWDFEVEYAEGSRDLLLSPGKTDSQKSRGSVVELMRGAAKGLFQQMRVGKQHQHFL